MLKIFTAICLLCSSGVLAQSSDFISRGIVEYEVKFNQKLAMRKAREEQLRAVQAEIAISSDGGTITTSSGDAQEMMLSLNDMAMPDYIITHYSLNFSWNHALYSPVKEDKRLMSPKPVGYVDLAKKTYTARTSFFSEDSYVYTDSLPALSWKILNETRKVAGFECRKAVAMLPDSVYVIAFYSQEILPQLGPELFSGLPGLILGLAVPQWYTTWFATKLELAQVNEEAIKPPSPTKGKIYTSDELMAEIMKQYKEMLPDTVSAARVKSLLFNKWRF